MRKFQPNETLDSVIDHLSESANVRRLYRMTLVHVNMFLRRPATLADTSAIDVPQFAEFLLLKYAYRTAYDHVNRFQAMARKTGLAIKGLPDNRGKPIRNLSDQPGTLWHLCLTRYFPTSVTIRSEKTRSHYRGAMSDLKEAVGHDPTLSDLNDEAFGKMMAMLAARGLSAHSVNERRNKLRALWEWCARKKLVDEFPTIARMKAPRRIPRAWTIEQIRRLMAACRKEPGELLPGVLAADWWMALGFLQWDTAERIGALLACQWDWLDTESATLLIPAEARKGQDSDALFMLGPSTMAALARLKPAGQELILPWPQSQATFYSRYGDILLRAGLPTDRKSKTHRMRKSVASHLQARGHDAAMALGHSTPQVTRDSYLDPSIVGKPALTSVLPSLADCDPPRIGQRPESEVSHA